VVQFGLNAEGVRKFQPGVASTLGFTEQRDRNAESVRERDLANACSVEFLLSRVSQGCRKLQPWAEIFANAFGVISN
jgi:hypothetical protein